MNTKPKLVSISSFNEWGEGTQIESAVGMMTHNYTYEDYGDKGPDMYLKTTKQWVKELGEVGG